ncbi:neuritin 1-like b isoform X2 [Perca fluviatilis]|uniref:neuritin 1-like b isoform X2 n=1 Tax=Perca fluviatilis TaxID=8168 RepID=UPI0019648EE4|nr:neuritin 1-like b isoform X2 [Perca fluviatilis]
MNSQRMGEHITFKAVTLDSLDLPSVGDSHQSFWFKRGTQLHGTRGTNDEVPTRQGNYAAAHRSLPQSWNAFHVCANSALASCPGDAAAVWESLRQESRKTQFSGNLYDMCASRTTLPPSTVPAPQSPPTSDQTNQETLKGQTNKHSPTFSTLMFPVCSTLLLLLRS